MPPLPSGILLEEMPFDGGSSKTKGGSTCLRWIINRSGSFFEGWK